MIYNFLKKSNHTIFLSFLSINYIFPLLIFGNITLFYHDTLDSEIVYNSVLGKILGGNFDSIKIFLNNQIQVEYLRRLLQPFSYFYFFFSTEIAYWIIDILVKLTSYFSFYLLTKKIGLGKFESSFVACLFACINYRSQDGFGYAIIPYIIYLISFKKNLGLKNFLIVFFAGINSDLTTIFPQLPIIAIISFFLGNQDFKKYFINLVQVFLVFVFFIFLSNVNLVYSFLFSDQFHRSNFVYESLTIKENLLLYFQEIFSLPIKKDWTFIKLFPEFLLFFTILIFSFFVNHKRIYFMLGLILLINSVVVFNNISFILDFRNSSTGILKSFNYEYVKWTTPLLYLVSLSLILKTNKKCNYILKFVCLFCIFFFQISSSIVPISKKFFFNQENYRNIYTFKGYYMYSDYKKIKSIVENKRVMSVGYDPMIAVMNNIATIDGYHNVYPLKYKDTFRRIIKRELDKDKEIKTYYDNYGSRVYAFVKNPENIDLDFLEAKKIGAEFVISKYIISNSDISLINKDFNQKIYLYKIN